MTLAACCAPILDGMPAPTAVQLMRSRYTAFALLDREHLLRTWHPRTRPADLDLDAALQWQGLSISETTGGEDDDDEGTVTFRAHWLDRTSGERGTLAERSTFRRRAGRWFYLDGEIL